MKIKSLFRFVPVLLACITVMFSGGAAAQENSAGESNSGVNLAVVAEPSSSYVSGDTTLKALNDGIEPRRSRDNSRGSYGNWNRTGTQWVQYDWNQPISTNRIDVYWWSDGRGIYPPSASRLLYWDGNAFVPVANPSGLGVEVNRYNTTTFDEVKTSRLRLEIDSDGTNSTGILEWKVYDSGKSPKFPPKVDAGIDRLLVLGGKTYLNGAVKTLSDEGSKVTWSKAAGPGDVTFENANGPQTTAKFSAVSDYVLKLTAGQGQLSSSSTLNVKVTMLPPATPLDVVYTKKYKIDNPLWNSRAKALIVNWIPHCIDQINTPNLRQGGGGIDNFIEAAKALAGQPHERHRGYVFSNAWVHQTVESMCIALMVDPQGDEEIIQAQNKMKETLEDWIPKILAAQEPDGYLQTAFTLSGNPHWTRRDDHEGYVAGYFIESAINHYTLTNGTDLRLYNAAKKLADCWVANIGPEPGRKQWYDGHQEMEQALVRFGRFVNDMEGGGKGDNYIKLAKFLLDCRKDGQEYDQSHLPVQQQYEAVGHAVRAVYSYSGMADVAAETGDVDYQSAVMSLWDNIVNKKYYVTGGIGSGETSEGFGPNYSLPNNSYCESCSSCGEIFFQYKMNLAYHDAKYADLYEETLYNALLGSIDLEGQTFYYTNPLVGGNRTAWHNCPCCVGNIPRTLLMIPTWTYVKSPDGIYVNLFIGSTVKVENVAGTDVEMVQETDYPWSGKIAITVNPATRKKFSVRIRVPDHDVSGLYTSSPDCDGISSISLNGSSIAPVIEKGYAVITRSWKAGDKIEFVLPMMVQRVKASDKIEADIGRVALRYGPLIYNVEQVEQDINQVLDENAALTTEWKGDLLGGVVVITGKWADGSDLMAIPNYARCNRAAEPSEGDRSFGGPGTMGGGRGRGRRSANSIVWIRDR
ncbi:MAG: glycoside hydrolase family 127 protein [Sedimentisphaerales bacterium]|nr:glycoside hydrolase family 127 protein [Sedimentisphaerales bacterium]